MPGIVPNRLARRSSSALLALAAMGALVGAALAPSAGAHEAVTAHEHQAHDHDHSAPGHTHDTPAPAPAPAGAKAPAAKPTAARPATTKALPDSLPKLKAAADKDTTNAKAQYRYGVALLDRDRPQEAIDMFRRATKAKPDYLEAWVNQGAAWDAIGRSQDARVAYRRALEIKPEDEIALCRMASSFYAVGMRDSAMNVLRETLAKHPRSHCSYFTLGVAYADGGMFREAIAAWQKVGEYSPGSPEAESANESVQLLKQYLGKDSVRVAVPGAVAGVPPGSGGPGEPIKGGEMMQPTGKDAKPAMKPATNDAKAGGK